MSRNNKKKYVLLACLDCYHYYYCYFYYYYLLLQSFSRQRWLMVLHWGWSDSKCHQIFRTLLSILAYLNYVIIWMVSTCPDNSKYFNPFINPSVTVTRVPITINIVVTLMFHSFFNSLARSRYLSFFSLSFNYILWSDGTVKSTIQQFFKKIIIIIIIIEFFCIWPF